MEPIELEVIMRDRTKDGVSGVTQSITNLEQTMEQATASFIADYDRQVEAVKRLENQIQSLRGKLDTLSAGTLADGLKVELNIAISNLSESKGELASLNTIMQAGIATAGLLGAEKEKLARVEANLQAVMAITNGIQEVANLAGVKSFSISAMVAKGIDLFTAANTRLAVALGLSAGAAQVLMATLTLGLSVVITGLIYAWNQFSSAQEEAQRKQEEAAETARRQAEQEEQLRKSVSGSVASQILEYKKLQMQYQALGNDMKQKQKFVEDNQEAFKKLGVVVGSVSEAENLLVDNEGAFLESMSKRAMMAAAMELASEKYKKAVEKMIEAETPKQFNKAEMDSMRGAAKKLSEGSGKSYYLILGEMMKMSQRQAAAEAKKGLEEGTAILHMGVRMGNLSDAALTKGNIETNAGSSKQNAPTVTNEMEKYQLDAEKRLKDQEIALEKDASERKKMIADKEYQEEIARIDEEESRMLRHYDELRRAGEEVSPEVVQVIRLNYEKQRENAGEIYDNKIDTVSKEDNEKKQKEVDELLKKYQSYATRRTELDKQYAADALKLETQLSGAKTEAEQAQLKESINILEDKKKSAVNSLEEEQKKNAETVLTNTATWKLISEDASRKSVKDIGNILEQAKQLYDYLDGKEGVKLPEGVDPEKVKSLVGDKDFKNKLGGIIDTKEGDLTKKNPFAGFMSQSENLFKSFKSDKPEDAQKAIAGLGESFKACTAFLGNMGDCLGAVFGDEVGYAIDQAMALAQSVFDVGAGAAQIASGDIVGGISSMVSGISSIFAMGKKVKAENAKVRKELEANERKSYLAELEVNALYRQRYEWAKKIGESTLNHIKRQGEELNNQSSANAKEQDELWKKLMGTQYKESETYKHGTWFRKAKIETEWGSLEGKSWEEIEQLAAAGKLSEEGMQYYEALKKAKEEGEDLAARQEEYLESVRETFTGTSFDGFVSSIVDGFKAGKRSAADFADSFEELMKGAVTSAIQMMAEEKSREFYEEWAALANDEDGLTQSDIAYLKEKYQKMMEEITASGEQLEEITGTSVTEGSSQKGAEAGAFTTMSQEQGTKLEGLFTSLQDHAVSIDDKMTDMSVVMFDSFDTLNRIADNTSCLMGMAADINEMKRDGIKMK